MKFTDRGEAGRRLADKLLHLKDRQPVVLALPRGGVAVGFEIARALDAPLDIVLVRKIGVPWQPELAIGAVTGGASPEIFIDRDLAASLGVPDSYIRRRPHGSSKKSSGAGKRIARAARRWRLPGVRRSSSMTGSPPARRCGSHCRPPGAVAPRGWFSPCPWRRQTRSQACARKWTRPCAWRHRAGLELSASTTAISIR